MTKPQPISCQTCEYFMCSPGGSACNALHTPGADVTECADWMAKDQPVQMNGLSGRWREAAPTLTRTDAEETARQIRVYYEQRYLQRQAVENARRAGYRSQQPNQSPPVISLATLQEILERLERQGNRPTSPSQTLPHLVRNAEDGGLDWIEISLVAAMTASGARWSYDGIVVNSDGRRVNWLVRTFLSAFSERDSQISREFLVK